MAKGLQYRSLIHNFFDGKITAAELKERVMALRQRQMELFSEKHLEATGDNSVIKKRAGPKWKYRAPDTEAIEFADEVIVVTLDSLVKEILNLKPAIL